MNKSKISYWVFGIGILICLGSWFIFKPRLSDEKNNEKKEINFSSDHYQLMKTDTFIALVEKKYNSSASIHKSGNKVQVKIENANAKTADFFNGNLNLLKIKDAGFDIKWDKVNNKIDATFEKKEHGLVVPNDVIINLAK